MSEDNQMSLSLNVEQSLLNLGITYTPGDSLSKTIRRAAKQRYLEDLERNSPNSPIKMLRSVQTGEQDEHGNAIYRDPFPSELNSFLDEVRMTKDIKAISDSMFQTVKDFSAQAVQEIPKHGWSFELTRVNAKGWQYYVAKPPTVAEIKQKRQSFKEVVVTELMALPDELKNQVLQQLKAKSVDLVAIKAAADKKAAGEAKKLTELNKAA